MASVSLVTAHATRLGALVGQGRTAEVFEWRDDQVVKLFRPGFEARAEDELRQAQAAQAMGKRTPTVHGLVHVGERVGLVFERVPGRSLMSVLSTRPWRLRRAARDLATLHARIHECPAPELPSLTLALGTLIDEAAGLTRRQRDAARGALATLPDGDRLCHGDLHPGNVIQSRDHLIAIDWGTAGRGDPLVDVSVTAMILSLAELPAGAPWLLKRLVPPLRAQLCRDYLATYSLSAQRLRRLESWQLPLAAARLGRGVAEERPALLRIIADTVGP